MCLFSSSEVPSQPWHGLGHVQGVSVQSFHFFLLQNDKIRFIVFGFAERERGGAGATALFHCLISTIVTVVPFTCGLVAHNLRCHFEFELNRVCRRDIIYCISVSIFYLFLFDVRRVINDRQGFRNSTGLYFKCGYFSLNELNGMKNWFKLVYQWMLVK